MLLFTSKNHYNGLQLVANQGLGLHHKHSFASKRNATVENTLLTPPRSSWNKHKRRIQQNNDKVIEANTKGEEATEAANPGRQLADAAHELGAGIDVDAGALVRHALIPSSAGGGAGHGGAPHPLARLREAEAVRVARAPASRGGRGGRARGPAEEAGDAGGGHGGEAAEAEESAWREDAAADSCWRRRKRLC